MQLRAVGTAGYVFTVMLSGWLALVPLGTANAADPNPTLERDLIALTNLDRTSNSLTSLLETEPLIDLARERSDDMLARNYFSHDIPPEGEKVFALMQQRGILYRIAGENLAWNNAAQGEASIQRARQDFMNSPTHRANILEAEFSTIGVGAIPGSDRIMYTVLFMRTFAEDEGNTEAAPGDSGE